MLDRDGYPPGVPCWVDTRCARPDAAAAFYGGLFGWEFEDVAPADAAGPYLVGRLEGRDVAAIGPGLDGADAVPSWRTYVRVESADTDATADAAARLGGAVVVPPYDAGPTRVAVLDDPEGARFAVSRYSPD